MISKIFFQLTKSATQKMIKMRISWALLKKTKIRLQKQTNYRLMQVKSIAEYSNGSILQYFRHSFSYHLSLRSFFFSIFEWPFDTGLL